MAISRVKTVDQTATESRAALLRELAIAARKFGMTELSKAADIPRTHLYKIFSEGGNPTVETLMRIARVVGVDISLKLKVLP